MITGDKLTSLTTREVDMGAILSALDETKAVGPDIVNQRVLHICSGELALPFTKIFATIL